MTCVEMQYFNLRLTHGSLAYHVGIVTSRKCSIGQCFNVTVKKYFSVTHWVCHVEGGYINKEDALGFRLLMGF